MKLNCSVLGVLVHTGLPWRAFALRDEPSEMPQQFLGNDGVEAGPLQFQHELGGVEPVFHGMVQQSSDRGMMDKPPENLFCVNPAAGLQNTVNFRERMPPVNDVMNDAEVEHGVVGRILSANGTDIAHPDADPCFVAREPFARLLHHARIEIKRVNRIRTKELQDELGAHPAPAAHFQGPTARHSAAHPK